MTSRLLLVNGIWVGGSPVDQSRLDLPLLRGGARYASVK